MFVVTIDQRGSRVHGDKVEDLLSSPAVAALSKGRRGVVRVFERTVGDEVQAVLDDARVVVDLVLDVARRGGWSIGIGAGDVDEPLPPTSRAGSGAAFILARTAVEAAKSRTRTVALAVRGADDGAGRDAEAVLVLAAATAARRSTAGWEVIDAISTAGDARQEDVAASLGISQQAVSQRLRTALHDEELAARSAAARLLDLAQG